ncbi:hypothetical protein [Bradyrhizobium sp. BR 10289]|uniref:hypothetical protein n=1 Tax=Bradyrhizobium sp. BR 10289 TaxID=2749993 RepID=UPI001C651866|nr:hypothetical protein [Bradyrhizobium sp. BR 10289]MBW7973254.1 hypothetical protein [Bradyrhizobium sp. BR 10289]
MKTYDELLDLSEFDAQSMMTKYIHHGGDINNFATTWEYVSFTYSLAFDELARKAYQPGHRVSNLSIPLFFLARHSIELALKGTIIEYAKTDDVAAKTDGHDLVALWDRLSASMERWGCSTTDDWGVVVAKQIADIQEVDPRGDRFRYPTDIKGKRFELTHVELEGLIRAHNSITTYLDACTTMLTEGYRG